MLKINTAVFCNNPERILTLHEHDCHQIICYYSGTGSLYANNRYYNINHGTVVYIPPKMSHKDFVRNKDLQYISILFDSDEPIFENKFIIVDDNAHMDLYNETRQVAVYNQLGDKYSDLRDMMFKIVCTKIVTFSKMNKDERSVHEYQTTIIENIAKSDFTVNDFMESQPLTRSNVSRKFKAVTKGTTKQFFDEQKIEYAKQLIMNDEENTADSVKIAKMCGYDEHYYFSRLFKQRTGMTIAEFRKRK